MNEEINQLIEKAKRSVGAAEKLFDGGDYDFSVSRSYYAMFYCAEAVLLARDLSFSKHSAVITNFGKNFVKTGIFPYALYSYLNDAFKDRQVGDYGTIITISKKQAETHIKNAEEFIAQTTENIKSLNGNG